MADWKKLRTVLPTVVGAMEPGSHLSILQTDPEVRFQFTVTPDGSALWSEVCNESPEDDPRLTERGWVMIDEWSGVWRRTLDLPASDEAIDDAVNQALIVLAGMWGVGRSDGFGYLAWQDQPERAWWQFWKPQGEVELKFPELDLPVANIPD